MQLLPVGLVLLDNMLADHPFKRVANVQTKLACGRPATCCPNCECLKKADLPRNIIATLLWDGQRAIISGSCLNMVQLHSRCGIQGHNMMMMSDVPKTKRH